MKKKNLCIYQKVIKEKLYKVSLEEINRVNFSVYVNFRYAFLCFNHLGF